MGNPNPISIKRRIHTLLPTLPGGLGAVVACMLLCSCSHGTTTADTNTDSDSTVFRIAILPVEECKPFVVAQQHGMFDTLGFEVRLDTFMAAMDADTAFINGWADMLVTDSFRMAYLNTVINGQTINSVITDTLQLSMLTTASSRIKSTKSLKEKIVAVTRNSAIDHFADIVMDRAKLKREELNRPQINDIRLRANMLNLDQYDGAILPEPYATQCEEQGARRIAMSKETLMKVVVKSTTQKQRKDDIQRITAAYWQAKELHNK